jgi:hypothetical protein
MKNTWMKQAKLKVPKIKYVFHAIDDKPGGTAQARAKLKSQLVAVASETAFPRIFSEY